MRYSYWNKLIKSENAARSPLQSNKYLDEYIKYRIRPTELILDYWCGKGRYIRQLKKKCRKLVAVDSISQIDRVQTINWVKTTLRKFYKNNNIEFLYSNSLDWQKYMYDYVFLINVLSAIPDEYIRKLILKNIKKVLNYKGKLIIVTKYNDNYFKKFKNYFWSKKHLDGYIYTNNNWTFFYWIINKEKLELYSKQLWYKIIKSYTLNGSAYIELMI